MMKFSFRNDDNVREQIHNISIDMISPNPFQPRKEFNAEEIIELANSIKSYGVIQPLTVRKSGDKYELIAGERRLRACKSVGITEVPVIIKEIEDKEMAEIALVENLQRKDLNFLEEARAYEQLLDKFNFTQVQLAEKIGKSQSTIANKIRILSLATDVCQQIDPAIMTERHTRALLKLKNKEDQLRVIEMIKEREMTVKETEKAIDRIINGQKEGNTVTIYKDLRLFINTLQGSIKEMKTAGLDVKVERSEDEEYVEFNIRLPKNKE